MLPGVYAGRCILSSASAQIGGQHLRPPHLRVCVRARARAYVEKKVLGVVTGGRAAAGGHEAEPGRHVGCVVDGRLGRPLLA